MDDQHPVSLAHELAAALMPDPSMTSRALADELGLEFDDGEEESANASQHGDADSQPPPSERGSAVAGPGTDGHGSVEDEEQDPFLQHNPTEYAEPVYEPAPLASAEDQLEQLTKDLTTTEHFLTALRRIDAEGTSTASAAFIKGHARQGSVTQVEYALEGVAAAVIRRLNDTAREREGQVRELLQCDREFQKLAAEVGGMDILAEVEVLEHIEGLELPSGRPPQLDPSPLVMIQQLQQLQELREVREEDEDEDERYTATEPEDEPHNELQLDADEDDMYLLNGRAPKRQTTESDVIPPPPPLVRGPASAKAALPQLAYMRTLTGSVVASLSVVSEHAQVGNAGATDAGRKLRALRNKLVTWRTEFESVERSRRRIEQYEKSLARSGRQVDARTVVQAELTAFARVLADANTKTQAIRSHAVLAVS